MEDETIPSFGLDDDQVDSLEVAFNDYRHMGMSTTKCQRLVLAITINAEAQIVGRWWAARERLESGVAKPSMRKTPEQIAILEEDFFYGEQGEMHAVAEMGGRGPYPDAQVCKDMASRSGLSFKQVKSWMDHQRKKAIDSERLQLWFDDDRKFSLPTHYQWNW